MAGFRGMWESVKNGATSAANDAEAFVTGLSRGKSAAQKRKVASTPPPVEPPEAAAPQDVAADAIGGGAGGVVKAIRSRKQALADIEG